MGENDKLSDAGNENSAKVVWTTPVLLSYGDMTSVLHYDGSAGDNTGMGSHSS